MREGKKIKRKRKDKKRKSEGLNKKNNAEMERGWTTGMGVSDTDEKDDHD